MAAKAHRALIFAFVLVALVAVFVSGIYGYWWAGALFSGLLLAVPAVVLALECCCLWRVEPRSSRPGIRSLSLAWAREVLAYTVTFGWRQPFRSTFTADCIPSAPDGRRAVLMVHGLACNRGFWNGWMRRLRQMGHPYLAIDLEPMFGAIEAYSASIANAVDRLQVATGLPAVIVAHSMGGLAVRHWLHNGGNRNSIHHIITIGTPHAGTWMARFAKSASGRQMCLGSDWLVALGAKAVGDDHKVFTCFYGSCDNVVFPAAGAQLPGADNRCIDATGHIGLAWRQEVFEETLRWLVPNVEEGCP